MNNKDGLSTLPTERRLVMRYALHRAKAPARYHHRGHARFWRDEQHVYIIDRGQDSTTKLQLALCNMHVWCKLLQS